MHRLCMPLCWGKWFCLLGYETVMSSHHGLCVLSCHTPCMETNQTTGMTDMKEAEKVVLSAIHNHSAEEESSPFTGIAQGSMW